MAKNNNRRGRSSNSNYYSDDMTKEVVGRLFEQYTADDGKNYFAPSSSRRSARDEEAIAKKEEDKKNFLDLDEDGGEAEEEKAESGLARFVRKAKLAILPPDDDDDDEDEDEDDENFDRIFDEPEQSEETGEESTPFEEAPVLEQQQTYVPGRKERKKKEKPLIIEDMKNDHSVEYNEEAEQENLDELLSLPVTEEEEQPAPRRLTRREKMEQRVEAKRRRSVQKEQPVQQEADKEPYEEEYFEDEETEVIEIPVGRIALIVIIAVVALLLLTLAGKCISYGSQLKEANSKIEELERMNTSSTYEKELEELKAKNEELTQQLESIQQASAVVSPTDSAGGDTSSQTAGDTSSSDTSGLSQQANDSRSYEVVSYEGQTLWDLAEEYYGSGSRYTDILEFNHLTADDFEDGTVSIGTELKIPN